MQSQLTDHQINHISGFFTDFPYDRAWLDAALTRRTGKLFLDDDAHPKVALLLPNRGDVAFISGDPHSAGLDGAIEQYIAALIGAGRYPWFLSAPSNEWRDRILQDFGRHFTNYPRVGYQFKPANAHCIAGWADRIPDGYHMRQVDLPLAKRLAAEIEPDIAAFWDTADELVSESLSFCLMQGDRIISLAGSAFPLGARITIGVATIPGFRGLGFSPLTCAPLIEHCLALGIEIDWDTGVDNEASRAVARKLGFDREQFHSWLVFETR